MPPIDQLCINTIRVLSMDAVQKADSGHPGTPMALAPLAYLLYTKHLRHNPADPNWVDRDRFILSAGHASMLLYSVLHLTGYDLSLDEIKNFRQWGSKTPGHPEHGHTVGVETTTGPLGQGFANAVGFAVAEANLAANFNKPGHAIVDHYTYFIAGDGCLMEGISHEAASFAGHFGLGKLIGFFDNNHITIEGSTDLSCSDDEARRFESCGWQVIHVTDANDLDALDRAIVTAKANTTQPSLIIVRSHIGFGSPNRQDTAKAHGEALGEAEVALTKKNLGWEWTEPFYEPAEAVAEMRKALTRGAAWQKEYEVRVAAYRAAFPDDARELDRRQRREMAAGWEAKLPVFTAENGAVASRAASGVVLNAIAAAVPELMGGSADLAGSTLTLIKGAKSHNKAEPGGRNMHFGIREHGMGGIMNGMALHGGFVPYGATFLVFSDYMRASMRLAAVMGTHVVYVFTHDSIGLGEDGPTHQAVEHLSALRAIPNMTVIRPADANETAEAWRAALKHTKGPVCLVLTRQKLAFFDRLKTGPASGVAQGAYVLIDAPGGKPDVVLMASGSEVGAVYDAAGKLASAGIKARVVSMASMELFAQQPESYRASVLLPGVKRLAMEAAHPMSWHQWVGDGGVIMGIDHFGASAPYQEIYKRFGLTADDVVKRATELVGKRG